MSTQLDNLRLNYKIWLETSGRLGVLGDKKCELLKAIDETGSLNDAMKKPDLTCQCVPRKHAYVHVS